MLYRPAVIADAKRLAEIYAPYVEHTAITFATEPLTPAEFEQKILSPYPFLVCEENGVIAGYAYASALREKKAYRWAVEPSIYIDPSYQGMGIGKGLMERLLKLLALQKFQSVYSCITLPNEKSIRLHEGFGFREVGRFEKSGYKLGKWHDVVWLYRPLADFPEKPPEPLPFRQLDARTLQTIL